MANVASSPTVSREAEMNLKIILTIALFALAGCAETPATETAASELEPAPVQSEAVVSVELLTQNESVGVIVTLERDSAVAIQANGNLVSEASWPAGEHSATILLAHGNTELRVIIDDGASTQIESFNVSRLSQATLSVQFNGYPAVTDREETIWFNIDAPYSASYYEGTNVEHPAYANVHDFMVEWQNQTGVEFEYAFSSGLGYTVSTIDGVGSPVSAVPGDPSENLYWLYTIDGESAELGISAQEMHPDVTVSWCLGGCQ
jgi:hypothetical protein